MCIELEYKKKPSGINITKSKYWCHILQDDGEIKLILMFPISVLKKLIKKCPKKVITYGGDDNESLICLLPLSEVLDYKKYNKKEK